jgi:hypothetical protein
LSTVEIRWHRRETRRQTENTNFNLNSKDLTYSPCVRHPCRIALYRRNDPTFGKLKTMRSLFDVATSGDGCANRCASKVILCHDIIESQ